MPEVQKFEKSTAPILRVQLSILKTEVPQGCWDEELQSPIDLEDRKWPEEVETKA